MIPANLNALFRRHLIGYGSLRNRTLIAFFISGLCSFAIASAQEVEENTTEPEHLEIVEAEDKILPLHPSEEEIDLHANEKTLSREPAEVAVQSLRLNSRSKPQILRRAPIKKGTGNSIFGLGPRKKKEVSPPPTPPSPPRKRKQADLIDESRLERESKLNHKPFFEAFTRHSEAGNTHEGEDHGHSLELSDEVIPYQEFGQGLPARPRTVTEAIEDHHFPENVERRELLESREPDDVSTEIPERKTLFGSDRFLSSGPIDPGKVMESGATWRPSFMLFGSARTALQSYEAAGGERVNEWANRLDLFGNLSLTSTERILIGFRPLDEEGVFTGVAGGPGIANEGFQNGFDIEPQTLFFEGYFDELFPFLDPDDFKSLDFGFSFGRQPFSLQNGILANDDLDALAITKHNLFLFGSSNARVSTWFAFNELHRGDNQRDSSGRLFALTGAFDYAKHTFETDLVYVDGSDQTGGDGAYLGLGSISQIGYWNSTFRVNKSFALNRKTAAVNDGVLLTHQLNRTMKHSEDIFSISSFLEIDDFTSAARGPETGGATGGFTLLQRAVGIGNYGPPIGGEARDQLGGILSYQHFLDAEEKKNILVAAGLVKSLDDSIETDLTGALGLQYQQSLFGNTVWSIGGFGTVTDEGDKGFGIRTELLRKF